MQKISEYIEKIKSPKGQLNKFGGYKYRSYEDILEAVKPLYTEEDVQLIISDELILVGERYYIKATATVTDGKELHCEEFEIEHPLEATEIVRKWAEEHPQKTMKDILLEKFPNAKLDSSTQRPLACAYSLGLCPKCTPFGDREECWNTKVEE